MLRKYIYSVVGAICLLFILVTIFGKPDKPSDRPQTNSEAKPVEKDWKTYLPAEDKALRKRYEQDPYIKAGSW
jgi:hypothetical protein